MDSRNRLHGHGTGFVTLFARAPQLCAAALVGLGSALWLNVVGPFAGLVAAWGALILVNALAIAVVAVLAILVTTAGTLLAADWQAGAASRQAWAEIDVAAAELRLRPETVALSQIDPSYLASTTSEALPSVFRTHRFASSAPVVQAATDASCATRVVVAAGEPIPAVAASEAAPWTARKNSTAAASEVATAHSPRGKPARASFGQELLVVASCRERPRGFRARTAAIAARLVANGAWSERLSHYQCVLTRAPPDRHVAHIVVLSSDRGDRGQSDLPGPSTGDSTVKNDEPPSCRGPPKGSWKVRAVGAPRPADPIACDDLGRQVPICAAELDVIETYLDHMLREVLAAPGSGRDSQTS